MIDDYDPPDHSPSSWLARATRRLGTGWFALILFGLALLLGSVAGMVWMKTRAAHPATVAAGPAMSADPTHRPLPAPSPGGVSTLPPTGTPSAEAPPDEPAPSDSASAPESNDSDSDATAGASSSPVASTPDSIEVASASDSDAQVVERSQPDYPSDALQAHEEGEVKLQVKIDPTGNVEEVRVVRSSGSHALDRAAIDAARTWHYRPARSSGQAISGTADVSVDFSLGEHN